jgi:hypothetical protein
MQSGVRRDLAGRVVCAVKAVTDVAGKAVGSENWSRERYWTIGRVICDGQRSCVASLKF